MSKNLGMAAIAVSVISNPVIFAFLAISFIVVFAIGYATLVFYGLVSALIYGAVGLLLVFLAGKNVMENHWQIIFLVPALFVFGWFSDRMGSFGLSVIPNMLSKNYVIASNTWTDGANISVSGSFIVAFAALVVAVLALVVTVKHKKKR